MGKRFFRLVSVLLFLLNLSFSAWAMELSADNVDEIKKNEGEFVSVVGQVTGTFTAPSGKAKFLNFGSDHKKAFTAVIFSGDLEKFKAAVGEPTEFYLNKKVKIEGRVKVYEGKPEIILNSPAQITVLESVSQPEVALSAADVEKIKGYSGKQVSVTGEVVSTHVAKSGKVRFLNFGSNWKTAFTAVIFTTDLESFKSVGEPTEQYLHKTVTVNGTVSLHEGRPQIILKSPKQITIK